MTDYYYLKEVIYDQEALFNSSVKDYEKKPCLDNALNIIQVAYDLIRYYKEALEQSDNILSLVCQPISDIKN